MTEPELTAAQEEQVRRLLAEARHGAPMPPEVVARLDDVLRDLAAERTSGASDVAAATDGTVVVSLDAARRRRRRATGLLVAAVAAAVVGIGVPSFVRGMSAGDDAASGMSASSADEAELNDAPREAGPGAGEDVGGGDGDAGADNTTRPEAALAGIPSVAASSFRRDVIRLADLTSSYGSRSDERSKSAFDTVGCTRPDGWGEGDAVAVLYADQPALLLFREPAGGLQQVDLFLCDSAEPELTTQVPAP